MENLFLSIELRMLGRFIYIQMNHCYLNLVLLRLKLLLKMCILLVHDQIIAELIQTGGKTLHSKTYKHPFYLE